MELNELKRRKNSEKSKIKKNIIKLLSGKEKMAKGEIFDCIISMSGLSASDLADFSANGIRAFYRGIIGMALSELVIASEIVKQDGFYRLNSDKPISINRSEVCEYVKGLISVEALDKNQIFDSAIKHFGTHKTRCEKDDNQLRSYIGDFISMLERSDNLIVKNGKYMISREKEETIKSYETFISEINSGGGEFFERYSAMLLKKYYEKMGVTVEECKVTGGSDDGGIDVVIRTSDALGFKDFVVAQVKVRSHAQITLKEVREFIGAMITKGGTRGIYITTSSFHPEAEKLIKSVANVTSIDGKKVYEMAKECAMMKI